MNFINWFTRPQRPPRLLLWLGNWMSLAYRVRDLELRVVELERRMR